MPESRRATALTGINRKQSELAVGKVLKAGHLTVDIALDGGSILRNVPFIANIPRTLLTVDRRVVVMISQNTPLVLGAIGSGPLEGTVEEFFTKTGTLYVDGVLELTLPGIMKCMATGYEQGTGFWFEYNNGYPRMFVGASNGSYWSFDSSTGEMEIKGKLLTTGGTPLATETGLLPSARNLLANPSFSLVDEGHQTPWNWVVIGLTQLLEGAGDV